tara:strand:- start:1122 stop:1907 length:786 start_codon:yes stop_codon:yes gene_type:complete
MINNKYKIERYLNQGTFGIVYKCSYNNKDYAVKCDGDNTTDYKLLKYEAHIYKELRSINNISRLIDFFLLDNKYYMVLDYYSLNLMDFKYRFFYSACYKERLVYIISKLIDIMRDIHNRGIVHRDLKPPNICLNKNLEPFIIDFGMAKKIIINNQHIMERNIHNIIGSPNYISLNVVNLVEPSRRDDMESIIYIIIYMLLDERDYLKYTNNTLHAQKSLATITDLIPTLKIPLKIDSVLLYIRKLNFSQTPNYDHIKKLYV